MEIKKSIFVFLAVTFVLVLIMSFVSASLWDSFKSSVTGKAVSQPTNVTIAIKGVHPCQVDYVAPIPNVQGNELSSVNVTFEVHVYDPDGFSDINPASVQAAFIKAGQTLRLSGGVGSCAWVNNMPPKRMNFTCTVQMWYWDGSGNWSVTVAANDFGNLTYQYNTTTSFQYNELKGMVISPPALTWDALNSGDINQLSNNDPTIVNNTGNYNGPIGIRGLDLAGQTYSDESITANNFTSGISSGTAVCSETVLQNGTTQSINGTNSNPGNLSLNNGAGQEELYYCIPSVPDLSSQIYSTDLGGSWTVSYL
jgi:hypothetical protein